MLNKRAPLNRLPFNRTSGVLGEINAAAAFFNHLNAAVGAGKIIQTEFSGGGQVNSDVILTTGFTHRLDGGAALNAEVLITPAYNIGGRMGGVLQNDTILVKSMPLPTDQGGQLQSPPITLLLNLPAAAIIGGHVQSIARIIKDMPSGATIGGLLNAEVDVTPLDVSTLNIVYPVYKGDSVFLDTENFVLLINERNALHAHVGDWPEVKRSTVRLEIDHGTGKLEGTLVVTPRYL